MRLDADGPPTPNGAAAKQEGAEFKADVNMEVENVPSKLLPKSPPAAGAGAAAAASSSSFHTTLAPLSNGTSNSSFDINILARAAALELEKDQSLQSVKSLPSLTSYFTPQPIPQQPPTLPPPQQQQQQQQFKPLQAEFSMKPRPNHSYHTLSSLQRMTPIHMTPSSSQQSNGGTGTPLYKSKSNVSFSSLNENLDDDFTLNHDRYKRSRPNSPSPSSPILQSSMSFASLSNSKSNSFTNLHSALHSSLGMTSIIKPSSSVHKANFNLLGKTPEATPLQTPAVSPRLSAIKSDELPPIRSLSLNFPVALPTTATTTTTTTQQQVGQGQENSNGSSPSSELNGVSGGVIGSQS